MLQFVNTWISSSAGPTPTLYQQPTVMSAEGPTAVSFGKTKTNQKGTITSAFILYLSELKYFAFPFNFHCSSLL